MSRTARAEGEREGDPREKRRHPLDLLAGLRVLELGDGVAGSAAGNLLAALGAEVTAVVDPASPHRRGRPGVADESGRPTSLLGLTLDRGKHVVAVPDHDALVATLSGADDGGPFDLVIVDRVAGNRGALAPVAQIDAYVAFVVAHNRRAWLTISAFGLSGPRAGDIATELTVAAAGGMLASVRDPATGQPLKLAGHQSLLNTGQVAALAACHAVDLAASGAPSHVDLSAVEATIATGPVLQIGAITLNMGSTGGAKRYGAPAGFYPCRDGLVRISAMEDHQWRGVVEAMGSPSWADQFGTVSSRIEAADEIDERVAAWAESLGKAEAEAVLQARGVPATAMYSPAEVLASPQLAHRRSFEPLPIADGRTATVVGSPCRVVGGGNDRADGAERRRRSLRGLRVLDASHVLAAPLCGAVLGALGAEVTKLEDLRRMDMYRRRGPYIDGVEASGWSAYFALVNHSKRSVAFDVDADRDRLREMLDATDVVVENLGRKRATALGLAASSVPTTQPNTLALSSSGFGQDGPHSEYRAYAYNLQASCALGYLTRTESGEPAEIDLAWADLISAFALATFVAAWAVGPSGNRGVGLDFAMADLIVAHFNEFLAAASLDADADQSFDRANELVPYAPHGVFPTADGWVAVATLGDHEVTEEVADAAALLASPHLAARDFFTEVEHPEWGRRRLIGIPWRPYGAPAIPLGTPPLLAPS